jgi:hypothetical protein
MVDKAVMKAPARAIMTASLPYPVRTVSAADNMGSVASTLDGFTWEEILAWLTMGESSVLTWDITPQANVWLISLPDAIRVSIFSSVTTIWESTRILFVPGKFLELKRGRRIWRVFDVSGFWEHGASLSDVCKRWAIACHGLISTGSQEATREWYGARLTSLSEWCASFASTLAQLWARVAPALEASDLMPARPTGIGAIASRMIREADKGRWIARYRPDRQPAVGDQELLPIFLAAYYGGRSETTGAGHTEGPIYRYDLRSAYPWALSQIGPVGYVWEAAERFREDRAARMSVWHVSWDCRPALNLGPLPYRSPSGRITYPLVGSGWYWWPEVRAALAAYGEGAIRVRQGYVGAFNEQRPLLGVIARRYRQRLALEASSSPVAEILKGAMAAMYGRLCQRIGSEQQPGRWYNPALAGWTTSAVRARLLGAWAGQEASVLSVMTDGLLTTRQLPITASGLGHWKEDTWASSEIILPGLYRISKPAQTSTALTGLSRGTDFDWLLDELQRWGQVTVTDRWFAPNLLADLFPSPWGLKRCRWLDGDVTVNPYRIARHRQGAESVRTLVWREDYTALYPYDQTGNGDSQPYAGPPAWQEGGADPIQEALQAVLLNR